MTTIAAVLLISGLALGFVFAASAWLASRREMKE